MFLTQRSLPRRTVLKGLGASVALPFLDAMTPAGARAARNGGSRSGSASAGRLRQAYGAPDSTQNTRLVCIEIVHGAAGSSQLGAQRHLWAPAAAGRDFDLRGTSLEGLERFRDRLTIVSNTDVASAD